MKSLVLFLMATLFFSIAPHVDARSGCCSQHGGVRADGCACNDGSSLSAKCAPYYSCTAAEPVQKKNIIKPIYPTATKTPIKLQVKPTMKKTKLTPTPTVFLETPTIKPTSKAQKPITLQKDTQQKQSGFLNFFLSLFGMN